MNIKKILTINPKSDGTKIAVYEHENTIFLKTINHELKGRLDFDDQIKTRTEDIVKELKDNCIDYKSIGIVMARGGLTKPLKSGIYEINDAMKKDLKSNARGHHASNYGAFIADNIAKEIHSAKAYISDPAVIDEMDEIARVSGHPMFKRESIFHGLSQKSVARKYAKTNNVKYEDLNLIVVTIRQGVSVSAHRQGKVVDVNQAYDGNGPFSMERTGSVPPGQLIKLCFSEKLTQEEIEEMITQKGGLFSYLGTSNYAEVEEMIENGDKKAAFYYEAFAYQISKEIGSMYAVLEGNVDGVVFSGDIFYSGTFTEMVKKRVENIAPISVYPHEFQMDALANNAMMIIREECEILEYK